MLVTLVVLMVLSYLFYFEVKKSRKRARLALGHTRERALIDRDLETVLKVWKLAVDHMEKPLTPKQLEATLTICGLCHKMSEELRKQRGRFTY